MQADQTGDLCGMGHTGPGRRSGSWVKAVELCLSYLTVGGSEYLIPQGIQVV